MGRCCRHFYSTFSIRFFFSASALSFCLKKKNFKRTFSRLFQIDKSIAFVGVGFKCWVDQSHLDFQLNWNRIKHMNHIYCGIFCSVHCGNSMKWLISFHIDAPHFLFCLLSQNSILLSTKKRWSAHSIIVANWNDNNMFEFESEFFFCVCVFLFLPSINLFPLHLNARKNDALFIILISW